MGKMKLAYDAVSSPAHIIDWLVNSHLERTMGSALEGVAAARARGNTGSVLTSVCFDPLSYLESTDRFMRSVVAYNVATYVLGIGDRHPSNLMITRDGSFFHIDFGHFLGNFKRKFKIEREKAPFVFTPQMAAVIGPEGSARYEAFENLLVRVFQVLRGHGDLFITLFALMLPSGIPELTSEEDLLWLPEHLYPDASDELAEATIRAELRTSLRTKTTMANFAAHIIAHE
jgi:hypothetical protein